MPDKSQTFYNYRDHVRMYASMLTDLSESDVYIHALVSNRTQTVFERTIRQMIEDTLREE